MILKAHPSRTESTPPKKNRAHPTPDTPDTSGYFVLLHQHEFHGKCFFHTQFALQLASTGEYSYENVKKYFTTKRTRDKKTIFMYNHLYFPINYNASHWLLIEYDVTESELKVYDSWPGGKAAVELPNTSQMSIGDYIRTSAHLRTSCETMLFIQLAQSKTTGGIAACTCVCLDTT